MSEYIVLLHTIIHNISIKYSYFKISDLVHFWCIGFFRFFSGKFVRNAQILNFPFDR